MPHLHGVQEKGSKEWVYLPLLTFICSRLSRYPDFHLSPSALQKYSPSTQICI
jgi:hypothetical protein